MGFVDEVELVVENNSSQINDMTKILAPPSPRVLDRRAMNGEATELGLAAAYISNPKRAAGEPSHRTTHTHLTTCAP